MSKPSNAVSALQSKIQDYLRQTVGRCEVLRDGSSSVRYGSARVIITAHELGQTGRTLVNVFALVVQGTNVTDELYGYLMEVNKNVVFGKFFAVEGQRLVVCQETLLGDKMGPEELHIAVSAVAQLADEYDDKIVAKFRGKTMQQFEDDAGNIARQWPDLRAP